MDENIKIFCLFFSVMHEVSDGKINTMRPAVEVMNDAVTKCVFKNTALVVGNRQNRDNKIKFVHKTLYSVVLMIN